MLTSFFNKVFGSKNVKSDEII